MAGSARREAIVPAYLFLCLMLGGSAQGIWVNALLQVLAILILAWAAIAPHQESVSTAAKRLLLICGLGLLVVVIQLVPLPPPIWSALPGRDVVRDGYDILGQPLPWMALTLTPDETLSTILRLLPPAAILAAMLFQQAYRPSWLGWALIAGTCAGVILGALQVTSGAGPESPWYPYPISNFGTATGSFANGNHMAILLVATIPFLFAMVANGGRDQGKKALQRRSALYALATGLLAVILLGLALNGSLAGIGLGLPVLVASAILLIRQDRQRRWLIAPAFLLLVAIGSIFALPVTATFRSLGADTSVESRRAVTFKSIQAAGDYMPAGSGLGSFARVYRLYEDPAQVDRTFVNHAHNDYLELALETGLPGVFAILLFLVWWLFSAWSRWSPGAGDPFVRAATIASAAILAHSLVDFPLRTSAIAAVFAMALAMMAQARARSAVSDESQLWPTRHVEVH
jgi:O-antigen ligase